MYSKSYILLLVSNIAFAGLLFFSKGIDVKAENFYKEEQLNVVTESVMLEKPDSLERVIEYDTLKQSYVIEVTQKDIDTLFRIVEAEAGGEDRKGKLLVANVVINRVKNSKFPDNVTDVVYQKEKNVTQFSPVSNGSIDKVKVSDETKEVVYCALRGEDVSKGALFFMARSHSKPENAEWFDNNLSYLFTHGGHDFFKR